MKVEALRKHRAPAQEHLPMPLRHPVPGDLEAIETASRDEISA